MGIQVVGNGVGPTKNNAFKLSEPAIYDIAIIGGGLAGLSLAIQAGYNGYRTVLFEKETYPFHRVCGEYISLESWNFLEQLGLPLSNMQLPIIRQLIVSAPNGNTIQQTLPLGGFGISRYTIDAKLLALAKNAGVTICEKTKVTDIQFEQDRHSIEHTGGITLAKVTVAGFGKRSNLDIKWKRAFTQQKNNKLNNFIGVKYHIEIDHPADTIALHNFEDGYCGISKIEEEKSCLCYLTTAKHLQNNRQSIPQMEEQVLFKNPHLKKIFTRAKFLYAAPETISQISFEQKALVENHLLFCGDAAGMITPLCGNGMSMALHSSKIAFGAIHLFLQHQLSRSQMEAQYTAVWKKQFQRRLSTGRLIQQMFGKPWLTNIFIQTLQPFPKFTSYLIRQTHGEPF